MKLMRSAYGLKNKKKFHEEDFIVYVEGGQQDSSGKPDQAFDILFWRCVFQARYPGKKFKFEPKGSKKNLIPLAKRISEESHGSSIYVAMDSDFDLHFNQHIDHPNVLYTRGYAWENDLLDESVIAETFYRVCPLCPQTFPIQRQVQTIISNIETDLRWLVKADLITSATNSTSAIPREKGFLALLSTSTKTAPPCIKKDVALKWVGSAKADRSGPFRLLPTLKKCHPCLDLYGHLAAKVFCAILSHLIQKYGKIKNPQHDLLISLGITQFAELLLDDSRSTTTHYMT